MKNSDHEQKARAYLDAQFPGGAYEHLTPVASFDESPLEGEGPATLFAFTARPAGEPEPFVVIAGGTQPNYYPSWNLSSDEVYDLHIGTRFMLVMEIAQSPLEELPPNFTEWATTVIGGALPGHAIEDVSPTAAFRLEAQTHVVVGARVSGQPIRAVLGGELPLGLSDRADLPPHVLYRMHLGRVIRAEKPDDEGD